MGRFGSNLARSLYQIGHDVMAIDIDDGRVQDILGHVTYPAAGDSTDENVLRELGVQDFDIGIVAIGTNVEANIMTAVLFKTMEMGYVVARAHSELHGNTLERIGCNRVIHTESEMGVRIAHNLLNPVADDYMEMGPGYGINRVPLPEHLAGLSLNDAGFSSIRDKSGVAVMAIRRGDDVTLIPNPEDKFRVGDILILSGRDTHVGALFGSG